MSRHVSNLETLFLYKIRRLEIGDQLRVSFTKKEYEASVEYTVQKMKEWQQEGLVTAVDKTTLERRYQELINTSVPFDDYPMLLWDPKLPTKPQLDVGQHRRSALINLYNKNGTEQSMDLKNRKVSRLSPSPLEQLFKRCK